MTSQMYVPTANAQRSAVLAAMVAVLLGLAAMAIPATADAQGRRQSAQGVPPGHLPAPGQCRVWYDGRPPGLQPAQTSCVVARREAARTGGRVIYGDDRRGRFERVDRARRTPYPDARYPATLPDMIWGVLHGRGQRLTEVRQWTGSGKVKSEYIEGRRRGIPEAVTWRDDRGRIVQRWIDDTGDGRANRVIIYENGRVARVIR